MKQEDYNLLRQKRYQKQFLLNQVAEIDEVIREIESKCDHTYPDGRDATYSGLISWECDICNR